MKKDHFINVAFTNNKSTWRCLLKRVGVWHILLLLFVLINQVDINLKVLNIKVGMKDANLPFAQVEALAKV